MKAAEVKAKREEGRESSIDPRKLAGERWEPRPQGELSGKQRGHLKRLAHPLKPTVLVGQEGLTEAIVGEIRKQLLLHELIKVRWSGIGEEEGGKKQRARELAGRVGAHLVTLIGQMVVLYRALPPGREPAAGEERISLR